MSEKTKHVGVRRIGERLYEVRATWTDPRTTRRGNLVRQITAPNAAAAAAKRAELRAAARTVESRATSRTRLHEYATSWLERKRPSLARSTLERYGTTIKLWILRPFGALKDPLGVLFIDSMVPDDVARWRDELTRAGGARRVNGKAVKSPEALAKSRPSPASPKTVNGHLRVLRHILADACSELHLADPASRITALPEPRATGANRLDAGELGRVGKAMRSLPLAWQAIEHTNAVLATRLGEVTALRVEDVDLVGEVITVRRSQWRGTERDRTKTGNIRPIPIPRELTNLLRRHVAAFNEKQRASGLLFPNEKGGHRSASAVRDYLRRALAKAGVDRRVTPHGLRRTMNQLLRQTAGGEVARAIVGHDTAEMTEHYDHISLTERREAQVKVLRLVKVSAAVSAAGGAKVSRKIRGR